MIDQDNPTAAGKLAEFVGKLELSTTEVARQFGVSRATLIDWTTGAKTPKPEYRDAIERWTDGLIKAAEWPSKKERERLAYLQTIRPARTGTEG